ncbi:MAG: DUF1836 domain-containing protein [Bacilli bacterium]|jgi:hypothetical protein|nr:DUF1836 domain-containing protein [Bacilli bacterium]
MEKEANELLEWLKKAAQYELPNYDQFPHVPLYMEQVVGYINEVFAPLSNDEKKELTSFMVNNYVKAKMIPEPERKKYRENQLGYLIAITALKNTMSMSEISLLMELDKSIKEDSPHGVYDSYRSASQEILSSRSKETEKKVEAIISAFKEETVTDEKGAAEKLKKSLGLLALRMAIESVTYKLIADMMVDSLAKALHDEKAYNYENTPGHHESKRELKIAKAQAERLAAAKVAQERKAAEEARKAAEEARKAAEEAKRKENEEKLAAEKKAKEEALKKAQAAAKRKPAKKAVKAPAPKKGKKAK